MVRLATRRASWHLRKEVIFVEMDRGSILEPRTTEEDALYQMYPMYLPYHLVFSLFYCQRKSIVKTRPA